jgi:hypothetical protein
MISQRRDVFGDAGFLESGGFRGPSTSGSPSSPKRVSTSVRSLLAQLANAADGAQLDLPCRRPCVDARNGGPSHAASFGTKANNYSLPLLLARATIRPFLARLESDDGSGQLERILDAIRRQGGTPELLSLARLPETPVQAAPAAPYGDAPSDRLMKIARGEITSHLT